jgi:hypothetical protein
VKFGHSSSLAMIAISRPLKRFKIVGDDQRRGAILAEPSVGGVTHDAQHPGAGVAIGKIARRDAILAATTRIQSLISSTCVATAWVHKRRDSQEVSNLSTCASINLAQSVAEDHDEQSICFLTSWFIPSRVA